MKTILITTIGALMLTVGGVTGINADHTKVVNKNEVVSNNSQEVHEYNYNAPTEDLTSLPEYETVAAKLDVSKYSAQIREDNLMRRVVVLNDMDGRERYKTVFDKTQNRLKIIDFKGEMIFDEVISGVTTKKTQTVSVVSDLVAKSVDYKKHSQSPIFLDIVFK